MLTRENISSIILFPLIIVFNLFFAILFWPIFLILTILSETARVCIRVLLYLFYDSTYKLMDACDTVYSYTLGPNDPGSPITAILHIKGEPDIELIRKRYLKTLEHPSYKKLTWSIDTKFGYPVWKETENFDIRKLIRYWEDPDDKIDEQRLYEIIGDYSITPLPTDHPEWQLVIVPQGIKMKDDNGEKTYAGILRLNHCYSDALSYILMMSNFIWDEPVKLTFDPTKPLPISIWQWIYIYSTMALFGPLRLVKNGIIFFSEKGKIKFSRTCFSSKSRALINRTVPVDFEALKYIKKKAHVSITTILYASISEALRKCHLRLYPNEKVPSKIGNSSQVIANLPYRKDYLTNGFAMQVLPIPLEAKENSKSERCVNMKMSDEHYRNLLMKCQKSGNNMMKNGGVIIQKHFHYFIGGLPKAFGQAFLLSGGSDVSLSNIPGPLNHGILNGSPIVNWFIIMPLMNIGIGIVAASYNGEFRLYIAADQRVIHDYENLEILSSDIIEMINHYKKIYTT